MIYWPPKHLTPRLRIIETDDGRFFMHVTIHDAEGRQYPELAEKFHGTLIVLSSAVAFVGLGALSLLLILALRTWS